MEIIFIILCLQQINAVILSLSYLKASILLLTIKKKSTESQNCLSAGIFENVFNDSLIKQFILYKKVYGNHTFTWCSNKWDRK